jgi:hypothetical protein
VSRAALLLAALVAAACGVKAPPRPPGAPAAPVQPAPATPDPRPAETSGKAP